MLARPLEGFQSLLARLSRFTLPLHRRLLVVLAPLHFLVEAVLQHLFLELLQGGLDLIIDDDDPHLAQPEMPC